MPGAVPTLPQCCPAAVQVDSRRCCPPGRHRDPAGHQLDGARLCRHPHQLCSPLRLQQYEHLLKTRWSIQPRGCHVSDHQGGNSKQSRCLSVHAPHAPALPQPPSSYCLVVSGSSMIQLKTQAVFKSYSIPTRLGTVLGYGLSRRWLLRWATGRHSRCSTTIGNTCRRARRAPGPARRMLPCSRCPALCPLSASCSMLTLLGL